MRRKAVKEVGGKENRMKIKLKKKKEKKVNPLLKIIETLIGQ